jgi:beta-glucanase (GH16 family)
LGETVVKTGSVDLYGSTPADLCTSEQFYGCTRTAGGVNIINPVTSARVRTAESFSFKYGRVEVKAKIPKGDWLWPAIWLLPQRNEYGSWPLSSEIDIMESRGNDPTYIKGTEHLGRGTTKTF